MFISAIALELVFPFPQLFRPPNRSSGELKKNIECEENGQEERESIKQAIDEDKQRHQNYAKLSKHKSVLNTAAYGDSGAYGDLTMYNLLSLVGHLHLGIK